MFSFLIPLIASLITRTHGGGLIPKFPKSILKVMFGAMFGIACFLLTGNVFISALGALVSSFSYALGHGTFYGMKGYESSNLERIEKIEYVVRPIFKFLKLNIYSSLYSWICMGIKGLLIGLPLLYLAPLMAVLWPTAYWIGRIVEDENNEVAEYLSGLFAGTLLLFIYMWMI